MCALLLLWQVRREPLVFPALAVVALLFTVGCGIWSVVEFYQDTMFTSRNFYGVLRVQDAGAADVDHRRTLIHGTIMHGKQYLRPELRREPTSYYTRTSGIGRLIEAMHPRHDPIKVGVIGLGTGTIASYGSKGDVYRFYDINPGVVAIAQRDFTYLKDSDATIELALGDARLSLEREPPQNFDVLAIDAFSSDAIPVHLITTGGGRSVPAAHEARRRDRIPRHQPLSRPGARWSKASRTSSACTRCGSATPATTRSPTRRAGCCSPRTRRGSTIRA